LDTTLRFQARGSLMSLNYTYSKSIDQGSNLGEQLNPIDPRASRTISAWDLKHAFVASYELAIPSHWSGIGGGLLNGWFLSGTARFTTGFPVTLYDNSDNSLLGTLGNGANNYLLDTPQYTAGPLKINRDGRSGNPAFNLDLFSEESPGRLGNAKRRMFYGPGIDNFDVALKKAVRFGENRLLDLRLETFNVFNHAQFYGPASVNGQVEDPDFGHITHAADPRRMQLVAKFTF
jgi:hypothetical protein